MMKMLISLDEEKILNDGIYDLEYMWRLIDERFAEQKCVKEVQADDSVIYKGNPQRRDNFSAFGVLCKFLNNENWFVDNCKICKLFEEFENTQYSISVDCLARSSV